MTTEGAPSARAFDMAPIRNGTSAYLLLNKIKKIACAHPTLRKLTPGTKSRASICTTGKHTEEWKCVI